MKVNPDDKITLLKGGDRPSGLQSLRNGGKTFKRTDEFRCKRILKGIVEGKVVTVVMSLITVYALVGVSHLKI